MNFLTKARAIRKKDRQREKERESEAVFIAHNIGMKPVLFSLVLTLESV